MSSPLIHMPLQGLITFDRKHTIFYCPQCQWCNTVGGVPAAAQLPAVWEGEKLYLSPALPCMSRVHSKIVLTLTSQRPSSWNSLNNALTQLCAPQTTTSCRLGWGPGARVREKRRKKRRERIRGGIIWKGDDYQLGWYWHILLTSLLNLPCSCTAICPELRVSLYLAMPELVSLLSSTKPHHIALATTNIIKTTSGKAEFIFLNYMWLAAYWAKRQSSNWKYTIPCRVSWHFMIQYIKYYASSATQIYRRSTCNILIKIDLLHWWFFGTLGNNTALIGSSLKYGTSM